MCPGGSCRQGGAWLWKPAGPCSAAIQGTAGKGSAWQRGQAQPSDGGCQAQGTGQEARLAWEWHVRGCGEDGMVETPHDCAETSLLLGGAGPREDPGSLRRRVQVLVGGGRLVQAAVGWLRTTGGAPGTVTLGRRGGFLSFPLPSPEAPQTKGSPAPASALSPRKPHHHGQEPRVPVQPPGAGAAGARAHALRGDAGRARGLGLRPARAAGEAGHRHEAGDGAEVGGAAPPGPPPPSASPHSPSALAGSRSWRTSTVGSARRPPTCWSSSDW